MCSDTLNDIALFSIYPQGYGDSTGEFNEFCLQIKFNFIHENIRKYKRETTIDVKQENARNELGAHHYFKKSVHYGFRGVCAYIDNLFETEFLYKYDHMTFTVEVVISDIEYYDNKLLILDAAKIAYLLAD